VTDIYDIYFRTLAASMNLQTWARVDQALSSQHFNWATARKEDGDGPSIGPYHQQAKLASVESELVKSPKGKDRTTVTQKPHQSAQWNRDDCHSAACTYRHICLSYYGQHREPRCPNKLASFKSPKPFQKEGGRQD